MFFSENLQVNKRYQAVNSSSPKVDITRTNNVNTTAEFRLFDERQKLSKGD